MQDVRTGDGGKLFEVGTLKGGEIMGDNGARDVPIRDSIWPSISPVCTLLINTSYFD